MGARAPCTPPWLRPCTCYTHLSPEAARAPLTYLRGKHLQPVALQVQLSEASQFANLPGQVHQVVLPQHQYLKVLQVPDLRRQRLEVVVSHVERAERLWRNGEGEGF